MVPELPLLDATRCVGCGDCVAVCPTQCLEIATGVPWLPRPCDCISCNVCVAICPTDALHLGDSEAAAF
jgi:ferredoxin